MITSSQKKLGQKIDTILSYAFPCALGLLLCYVAYRIVRGMEPYSIGYFLLYLAGLMFSFLSSARLFGLLGDVTNLFCGERTKKYDCDSVIASKGAFLIGEITWSDVGFIYFAFMLLVGLFPLRDNTAAYILSSFLTAPYIAYSIYYQWRIARSWCPMCLAVQVVLLLQFVLSLFLLRSDIPHFRLGNWLPMTVLLPIVVSGYLVIKKILKQALQYERATKQYETFRLENAGTCLFVSDRLDLPEGIVFHANAGDRIAVAFRFSCTPCMFHLNEIIETIETDPNLAVEFIFNSEPEHLKEELPLMLYFATIYFSDTPDRFLAELKRYIADYPLSKKTYAARWSDANGINPDAKELIMKHISWCKSHNIRITPTCFLNGKVTNRYYRFCDLKKLIAQKPATDSAR